MTDFDELVQELTFHIRDLIEFEVGSDDPDRLPPAFVIGRRGIHFALFPFVDADVLKLHVFGFDGYGRQRLATILEVPS